MTKTSGSTRHATLRRSATGFTASGGRAFIAVRSRRSRQCQSLPQLQLFSPAAVGIVINSVTALMFFRDKEKDINIKGAYLHLLSDAIVSAGIVLGGVLIYFTNYFWIDAVLSIVIALVILLSTWNLLKQSLHLSLDGTPAGLSIEQINSTAKKIAAIKDIHHIHLWAISTTKNAMTAHIVVDNKNSLVDVEKIKHELKHELEHLNIHHITLEVEPEEVALLQECSVVPVPPVGGEGAIFWGAHVRQS